MPRILLVDDSADFRKLLIHCITNIYGDVACVEYDPISQKLPGADFIWADFDLLILDYDLGLEGENGLDWMRHFNSIIGIPPVLMLTTVADAELSTRVLKAGAIDFMDKEDISTETIKTTLDAIFSLADKQQALIANQAESEKNIEAAPLPELLFQDEDDFFDISSDRLSSTYEQLEKFGLTVPGYEIIEEIGQGGMSTVLLARSIEDDNAVVLKIIFTKGHENPITLKGFVQEYALISYLNHPNVARIYERAFASNFAYIAMEHFPGGDLTQKLKKGIALERVIEYIYQICSGLSAVHELNIVHCDIKPGNILFRANDTLAITDFGAAKNLTNSADDITTHNYIIGTPYYMSPEQSAGMVFDHRSDLYSLGIMIFQMLTNKRPYNATSVTQLISMHTHAPIPKLPPKLIKYQPLIDGLLMKDPDERFQSARDVILGLDWIK